MSAKVHLQIKGGPKDGALFTFAEHDTFLFGRMPDCHACFPDDTLVSRHHFILEANPPLAALRDLGSLNGTFVNDVKYGSRVKGETPEEGAKRRYPEVQIKHGDRIRVGQTVLEVRVENAKEPPAHCIAPELADISLLSPEQLARAIFGSPEAPAEKPKLQVPGYTLDREIGRGGFGAVYLGRRIKDKAPVAIKVMLPRADVDAEAVEKFKREVAITAKLEHPNIVKLFDYGADGATFFFIMEYCDEGSVADFIAKCGGRIPLSQAKPIILSALTGLAHAHQQGFVHRDLKPQNILISKGDVRLSDFGLSKNFQAAGLSGMSVTGNYAGTPCFMPREQITNFKYVQPVSDVWSMAATIYNMLTGAFPYEFTRQRDPIDVILNDDIVPIGKRDGSFPSRLTAVMDKALAKNSKERYQTACEFLNVLIPIL